MDDAAVFVVHNAAPLRDFFEGDGPFALFVYGQLGVDSVGGDDGIPKVEASLAG